MINKSIVIIVIAAVVLAAGYFLVRWSYQPPASSPVSGQQPVSQPPVTQAPASQATVSTEQHVVTYTDSGYSPSILRVKAGTTVTFKNGSSRPLWTASGVHPTHRLYPTTGGCIGSTFDACQGIQPGGAWPFTFDIAGTWKYHNHLNPSDTGTIVVE